MAEETKPPREIEFFLNMIRITKLSQRTAPGSAILVGET